MALRKRYPEPTVPTPDETQIEYMMREALFDSDLGNFETTDGCEVEPDGMCEHGHPTWLRRLGLI